MSLLAALLGPHVQTKSGAGAPVPVNQVMPMQDNYAGLRGVPLPRPPQYVAPLTPEEEANQKMMQEQLAGITRR